MPPSEKCYRCKKPFGEPGPRRVDPHVYCESCAITVARRIDPHLARVMEESRRRRAQFHIANRAFLESKKQEVSA